MTEPPSYGNPGRRGEVELVRSIYEAFAARDLDGMESALDPAVVLHLRATASRAGKEGPYVGYAGVREYFADLDAVWDELTLHADDIRAVAGSVVVFGHVTGRRGDEALERQVIWTWIVREGRAVSVRADELG